MELALDQGGFLFQGEAVNDRQDMPLRGLREHELCRVTVPRPLGMAQDLLHGGQHLLQSYLLMPPQLPEVIPTAVRGDFEQPGPCISVFRQFAIAFIGPEKCVLTEIFGLRRPARQPPDVEINLSVVLGHEVREALVPSTALHASTSARSGRVRGMPARPCLCAADPPLPERLASRTHSALAIPEATPQRWTASRPGCRALLLAPRTPLQRLPCGLLDEVPVMGLGIGEESVRVQLGNHPCMPLPWAVYASHTWAWAEKASLCSGTTQKR